VRFFVWQRYAKAIAFGGCIVHGDTRFAQYLGLDYSVALKLLPYHYVFRELVRWPIASGSGWLQSTSLNRDPKLHLRYHSNPLVCMSGMCRPSSTCSCGAALPVLEPTRHEASGFSGGPACYRAGLFLHSPGARRQKPVACVRQVSIQLSLSATGFPGVEVPPMLAPAEMSCRRGSLARPCRPALPTSSGVQSSLA
jgi:hypothetical protein